MSTDPLAPRRGGLSRPQPSHPLGNIAAAAAGQQPTTHSPTPVPGRPARRRSGQGKGGRQLNVRQPERLMDEIDAAIEATAERGGPRDKTDYVLRANHLLLQQLRDEHNSGQPFKND